MALPSQPRGPVAGQRVGDYEVVAQIAQGRHSDVYQAHHPKTGRPVAIKVLHAELCGDPTLIQLYEHEVWAANHLGHPALVDGLDFGTLEGGRAYLVTRLLKGRPLTALLQAQPRVSVEEAQLILKPVLEALAALHGAGLSHKDLKPSNVFLESRADGGYEPKLLDVGLAHLKPLAAVPGPPAPGRPAHRQPPWYAAPEQVRGDLARVGSATDVYAVGALLYHLLAGAPPFPGGQVDAVAQQVLQAPPPDLSAIRVDLHPKLARVAEQAMAKSPEARFASAAALQSAFVAAAALKAPTLKGRTAVPPEEIFARARAAAAPPASPSARSDATPPPTLRIDAAQMGLPQPPSAGMAPTPGMAPTAAPGKPPRRAGLIFGLLVVGLALVGAVVAGLVIANQDDDDGDRDHRYRDQGFSRTTKRADSPPVALRPAPRPPPGWRTLARPVPARPLRRTTGRAPRAATKDRYRVRIAGHPWQGAEHAKVTIAWYGDFACLFTRRGRDRVEQVLKAYPKDVKVVWMAHPRPFRPKAMLAAIAGREVYRQQGNTAFWAFHRLLFEHPYTHSEQNLVRWAQQVGADGATVKAALRTRAHEATLIAERLQARAIGVRLTPTLYINGRKWFDPRTAAYLKQIVDQEIAAADRVIGTGGVTKKTYYAHLMRTARVSWRSPYGRGLGGGTGGLGKGRKRYGTGSRYRYRTRRRDVVHRVPVSARNPRRGPQDALVTVVMFADFECPFCSRLACALKVIRKEFPREVRIIWMNNPLSFHPRALPMAKTAMAVFRRGGNRAFWRMHDQLFPSQLCQPNGTQRYGFYGHKRTLTESFYERLAVQAGLSRSAFRRELISGTLAAQIRAEQQLAKALGATGTPTMFVNGRYHAGAQPVSTLRRIVRDALAAARKLRAQKGWSRAQFYGRLIATGVVAPVYH